MSYGRHLIGQVVGNGHCVPFVREVAGLPPTQQWRRGPHVRSSQPPAGTPIATFSQRGRYENKTDGSSHAAILLAVQEHGLLVLDQWVGQPVHERVIRFRDGFGPKANDGDRYYVIMLEPPPSAA